MFLTLTPLTTSITRHTTAESSLWILCSSGTSLSLWQSQWQSREVSMWHFAAEDPSSQAGTRPSLLLARTHCGQPPQLVGQAPLQVLAVTVVIHKDNFV